jgi:hypothetical protein
VVPLPSDDERTTICADRKRERFIFCATWNEAAAPGCREDQTFDDYFNISVDRVSVTD